MWSRPSMVLSWNVKVFSTSRSGKPGKGRVWGKLWGHDLLEWMKTWPKLDISRFVPCLFSGANFQLHFILDSKTSKMFFLFASNFVFLRWMFEQTSHPKIQLEDPHAEQGQCSRWGGWCLKGPGSSADRHFKLPFYKLGCPSSQDASHHLNFHLQLLLGRGMAANSWRRSRFQGGIWSDEWMSFQQRTSRNTLPSLWAVGKRSGSSTWRMGPH